MKYLSKLSLVLIATLFLACEGSDEPITRVIYESEGPRFSSELKDSIRVDFRLINERGDTTTVFGVGEDIIFDLSIRNHSNYVVWYGSDYFLFSHADSLFRVYDSSGMDFGTPVHIPDVGFLIFKGFNPGASVRFQASWYGALVPRPTPPLEVREVPILPKGKYHVAAPAHVFIDYKTPMSATVTTDYRIECNDSIYFHCGLDFEVR